MIRLNCFFPAKNPEVYKTALNAAVELTLRNSSSDGLQDN